MNRKLAALLMAAVFAMMAFAVLYGSRSPTGLAVDNEMPENLAPVWVSNSTTFEISANGSVVLNLNELFIDPEGESLTFIATESENLTIELLENELAIIPDAGFAGERTVSIMASDSLSVTTARIRIDVVVAAIPVPEEPVPVPEVPEPVVNETAPVINETIPQEPVLNETVPEINETAPAAPAGRIVALNGRIRDELGADVGTKTADEPDYETFFTFIGIEDSRFVVRFYHNASSALPVRVEGNEDAQLGSAIAEPGAETNVSVPLNSGGGIPRFSLHVGEESEIFEFGTQELPPDLGTMDVVTGCPATINTSTVLTQNIASTTTCITIGADNIVLDCAGFQIQYGSAGGSTIYGVYAKNHSNVTITSCEIRDTNAAGTDGYGILFQAVNNSLITNTTIKTNGTSNNHGIYFQHNTSNNTITNNTIFTLGSVSTNYGIYVYPSLGTNSLEAVNNLIENNTINATSGSQYAYGIYLNNYAQNNTINNNTIKAHATSGYAHGMRFEASANNNTVSNNVMTTSPGTVANNYGMYLYNVLSRNSIINNIITVSSSSAYGIYASTTVQNLTIANNTVTLRTSGANNIGILFSTSGINNFLDNNTINVSGTNTNTGIEMLTTSNNNTITNNNIYVNGSTYNNYGIYLATTANYNVLSGNTIYTNGTYQNYGLYITNTAEYNNITNNTITTVNSTGYDNYGIYLATQADNSTISDNNITTPGLDSYGIYIYYSQNETLTGNNFTTQSDGLTFEGSQYIHFATHTIESTNTINGSAILYYGGYGNSPACPDNTILDNPNNAHIDFIRCTNVTLTNFNAMEPVTLAGTANSTISYSTFINNWQGIQLFFNSTGNTITNNNITSGNTTRTGYAIWVYGARNNTITNNNLSTANPATAYNYVVYVLGNSSQNNITNNIISSNGTDDNYGIFLNLTSNNNLIANNAITTKGTSSANYGIYIYSSESGNTVHNNTIITNGTLNNHGIYLYTYSSNNTVENNTIICGGNGNSVSCIRIETTSFNNTIANNQITVPKPGYATNWGIYLATSVAFNTIRNNTVLSNGSNDANGIYLYTYAENNTIANNNFTTQGTSSNAYGIYLSTYARNNRIENNTINTSGTTAAHGIYLLTFSNNNTINNNVILTQGSTNSNNGIYLYSNVQYATVSGNTITTNGTYGNYGIALDTQAQYNNISNNSILTSAGYTNYGILLTTTAYGCTIADNNITTIGTESHGIRVSSASDNTFAGNNISITNLGSAGLYVTGTNYTHFTSQAVETTNSVNGSFMYYYGGAGSSPACPNDGSAAANAGHIDLINCRNVTINNYDAFDPVTFLFTTNSTLNNSQITYAPVGLRLFYNNSGNTISNCNITADNITSTGAIAIQLQFINHNNTITNNNISTVGRAVANNYAIYLLNNASENNITNNIISTNGTTDNYGIYLTIAAHNNLIQNNTITTTGTGVNNYGLYLYSGTSGNIINNNSISTYGSGANHGVYIYTTSSNHTISNNTISTDGTAANNHGIRLETAANNNTIISNIIRTGPYSASNNYGIYLYNYVSLNTARNNTIVANSSTGGHAIHLSTYAQNNTIDSNTVSDLSSNGNAYGIYVYSNAHNNTIENNSVSTFGTIAGNYGIVLYTTVYNNTVRNNTIWTNGSGTTNYGIILWSTALNNTIDSNTIVTNGSSTNHGIYFFTTANKNQASNNNITTKGTLSYGVAFSTTSVANFLNNTLLNNCTAWILSDTTSANNFSNTTFASEFGAISILPKIQLNATQILKVRTNITSNRAFLNSTNQTYFNTTGIVRITGVGVTSPTPQVDYEDDGTYIDCPAEVCTLLSSAGNDVVFNVSHFTSFAVSGEAIVISNLSNISVTKTGSPDPVNVSSNLTYQINVTSSGNGTAYNVTVNDTYPNEIIYLTSKPTPLAGTNNTWILGNLTQGTNISVNITVLVRNITNGTLINNTVNVTFQNETSDNLSANTSISTTVLNHNAVIVFDRQLVPDIDSTNAFGVQINVSYNISSPLLVNSTIYLHYKTNSSISDITYYVNGTAYAGYFLINYSNASNETYSFYLRDNKIYPATYNFDEEQMEDTPKSNFSLGTGNTCIKTRLFNVTNTTQYSFFEVYARNQSGGSAAMTIYYCNSSYATGSPATSTSCISIRTITAATPYNHTHTQYSSHFVVPLAINTTSGKVGTVKVTPVSYFIVRGSAGGGWLAYYITNISRVNTTQTSTNLGGAWTNLSGTVDAHLHQFDANESLWYYACANNTLGNQTCSALREDLLNLSGLPPTPPAVYSPVSETYAGNIPINYTAALSPNDYNISFYNITLLNLTLGLVQVIRSNNSLNLSYLWDSTTSSDGDFIVGVTACDILGQCSTGYSDNFTIYNHKRFSNISVTKTDNPDPVSAGTNLNYQINVTANGNATAWNVTVNDTYPNEVVYLTSQPTPLAGTNNTWILGNLTVGTNFSVNITVSVLYIVNGSVINNTVNVTFQNESSDNLSVNASASTVVLNPPVFNLSNISVTKTGDQDFVSASTNLTYQINVTSNGNGTAFNVTVNDTYPNEVIYLTSQPDPLAGTNNTWILGNLSAGTNISVNITVLVLNISNGSVINNTVNVTFQNETSGTLGVNATVSATVLNEPVINLSNLTVTKTDYPDPVNASGTLTYQINVSSTGNINASNVTVNETYPAEVIYVGAQPAPEPGTNNTWILGNLSQGANISINITVLVMSGLNNGTVITNSVNVTYQNSTGDVLRIDAAEDTTVLALVLCANLINTSTTLVQNVFSNCGCIGFNSSNITLDCAGYNITYGLAGSDYCMGINVTNVTNITIANCVILAGNTTGSSDYGIGIFGSEGVTVENTTIITNGTGGNDGIHASYYSSMGTSMLVNESRTTIIPAGNVKIVDNTGSLNNPFCRSGLGISTCNVCFTGPFTTHVVMCPNIGDAGCPDGEYYETQQLISFNTSILPANGTIRVIGGENVYCDLNNNRILEFYTRNNCGTPASAIIPGSAFVSGENNLTCGVAGSGHDEDNGLKISYFSYYFNQSTVVINGTVTVWVPPEAFNSSNVLIKNATIKVDTHDQGFGVYLNANASNITGSRINITSNGSNESGIAVYLPGDWALVANSTIIARSGSTTGIYSSAANAVVADNNVTSIRAYIGSAVLLSGQNCWVAGNKVNVTLSNYTKAVVAGGSYGNITGNTVLTSFGFLNPGISVSGMRNTIENNTINASSNISDAMYVFTPASRNLVQNNTIKAATRAGLYVESALNNDFNNSLLPSSPVVKSSLFVLETNGSMNYSESITLTNLTNLTDVITIGFNSTYLKSADSAGQQFNKSAILSFFDVPGLDFSPVVDPEDDGTFIECDTASRCLDADFNASSEIYSYNVTSFTTYAGEGTINCGILDLNPNETNATFVIGKPNLNATITCFEIYGENITLNCNGSIIYYGISGSGHGINVFNTSHIWIENCTIIDINASGAAGYGIYVSNSTDVTIRNNTIKTNGTYSNNGIHTLWASNDIEIRGNTIRTWGTSTDNDGIYLAATNLVLNNTIVANNILANSSYGGSKGIVASQYAIIGSRIENNTIVTDDNATPLTTGQNEAMYLIANNTIIKNNNARTGPNTTDSAYNNALELYGPNNTIVDNNFTITGQYGTSYVILISNQNGYGGNIVLNNNSLFALSNGTDTYALYAYRVKNITFENNTMLVSSYSDSFGIYLQSNDSVFRNNYLDLIGADGAGYYAPGFDKSYRLSFINNTMILHNDFTEGIILLDAEGVVIESNNITAIGNDSYGLWLGDVSRNYLIRRNNILFQEANTSRGVFIFNYYSYETIDNITIENNTISLTGAGEDNEGIRIDATNTSNITIANNTIKVSGYADNNGIAIIPTFGSVVSQVLSEQYSPPLLMTDCRILNNTITANGTGMRNTGIYVFHDASNLTIRDNKINASGAQENTGILFLQNVSQNVLTGNNITTQGSSNYAILLLGGSLGNYSFNDGFEDQTLAPFVTYGNANWTISNISAKTGNYSAQANTTLNIGESSNLTVNITVPMGIYTFQFSTNHSVPSRGWLYFYADSVFKETIGPTNWTASNITLSEGDHVLLWSFKKTAAQNDTYVFIDDVVLVPATPCVNNSFENTSLAAAEWVYVNNGSQATFTNTLFSEPNGSIRILPAVLVENETNITKQVLNTTFNLSHLNAANLSTFNTSAEITLNGLPFTDPKPIVDYEDDGTYIDCPASQCTELSYTAGVLVYNTTRFTGYSSTETVVSNVSNLTVSKTDYPDPVNVSSNLTYQINVSVIGNDTVYNVTVNDTYPNEVIYLTSQPDPVAGTNNTWILGNLTQGTNISINITVLVQNITSGSIINNTVNVTFQNATSDILSANDTASTTVVVPSAAILNFSNISVTKTDSPDPVNVSSNLTYQINVTSNGNGTAYNVTVNDTYPNEVIYLTSQPDPVAGTNNTWILGNLTNGTNISINITVLVQNITNGSLINNTVNVTFNNETSALLSANASASTTVEVPVGALFNFSNISITKTDSPDPVNASSNLTYQINVTSNGNGTAYNVTVNDTYPNEVIYLTSQPDPVAGTNNTWILGNLSVGTNISVNITVLVLNITNGTVINNTVNVTFQNETSALLSANASASTTVLNPPFFNFSNASVTKTDYPDPVNASSNLTYQINVSINGNETTYNVTVNDTYPAEVIYLTSQPDPVPGTNNTWILGNLSVGTNISVNITVLVRNITNGTVINNTANVTFQNTTSSTFNTADTENTTVLNPPLLNFSNISVTKTDSPDPVDVSTNLTYQINVSITGNGTAYNVTVNDTYPAQVIYLTSQPTPLAGTNNTWVLGNLSVGTNISINITVLVLNITNGTVINNTANASFQNETSGLFNYFGTENTTVLNLPVFNFSNISITKTNSPDPVAPGATLSYTIRVNSTGNGTAYNVTINDTYPGLVVYSTSQPTPLAGTNNTWILGNLTPGTTIVLNITVTVSASAPNSVALNNTVNATFNNETSALLSANASSTATVTAAVPPTPGGGSSGGGPGGVQRQITKQQAPSRACVESWECEEWQQCIDGSQTRLCIDVNNCTTLRFVPKTERECREEVPAAPAVQPVEEKPESKPIGQVPAPRAGGLFKASLWLLLLVIFMIILITFTYWRISRAKQHEAPLQGRIERRQFYGKVDRIERSIEQIRRKEIKPEEVRKELEELPEEPEEKGPVEAPKQVLPPKPQKPVVKSISIKEIEAKESERFRTRKPMERERFYGRISSIDTRLDRLGKARHLAGKARIGQDKEEEMLEQALGRFAHEKVKLPKPKAVPKQVLKPAIMPEPAPMPVKYAEPKPVLPLKPQKPVKSISIREIEAKESERFRAGKPRKHGRFYSGIGSIDARLDRLGKARHLAGKARIRQDKEEEQIEQALGKLARQKVKLPKQVLKPTIMPKPKPSMPAKPKAVPKLVSNPVIIQKPKPPMPAKHAEPAPVLPPKPQKPVVKSISIREIEAKESERFRAGKPMERERFYGRMSSIDVQLDNLDRKFKRKAKKRAG